MHQPQGTLTAAQFEIMQAVWESGAEGRTVAGIWEQIGQRRDISRTTVLNQVDRLERRGWLRREQREGIYRYFAALERRQAEQQLAEEFVEDFFGGSAADLVMSLLGRKNTDQAQIEQLRKLVQQAADERPRRGGRP